MHLLSLACKGEVDMKSGFVSRLRLNAHLQIKTEWNVAWNKV